MFNKLRVNKNFSQSWGFVIASLTVMAGLQLFDVHHLRFQQSWFSQSEFWRVITGHWVHFNWRHLALNGLGLVLCVAIARPAWPITRWVMYHLMLATGISVLFTLFNPELDWYVGYSGVLFGILLLTAIDLYRTEKLVALLLGIGVCSKVVLEQTSGMPVTTHELSSVPVVIDAHLYGLLSALLIALGNQVYTMAKMHSVNI